MKVFLVSEGKHELGGRQGEGALARLTCRMMNEDVELSVEKVSNAKVRIHKRRGKAAAYEHRALSWVRYAANNGFNALVLVIDQDGQSERQAGIDAAQANQGLDFPRALGVAIRKFDAWMLADESALSKACGKNVQRQKSPESIRDPKAVCDQLLNNLDVQLARSELYVAIAAKADLELIAKRCPNGFAPFKTRVENLTRDR